MSRIRDVKPHMQAATIELGGKKRTIQFDLNAFAELENRFGTIQSALEQLEKGRMNDVKTILWAGLIHEEAIIDDISGEAKGYNITPYQVGSWIKNPSMLNEVTKVLGIAMSGDLPAPENMGTGDRKEVGVEEPAEEPTGPKLATIVLTPEQEAAAKNV